MVHIKGISLSCVQPNFAGREDDSLKARSQPTTDRSLCRSTPEQSQHAFPSSKTLARPLFLRAPPFLPPSSIVPLPPSPPSPRPVPSPSTWPTTSPPRGRLHHGIDNQKHSVSHYRPYLRYPSVFAAHLLTTYLIPYQYRLCNPPPAVGKVRSCKGRFVLPHRAGIKLKAAHIVTPMFKVKLDDVLNRKHLPPLGKHFRLSSAPN